MGVTKLFREDWKMDEYYQHFQLHVLHITMLYHK